MAMIQRMLTPEQKLHVSGRQATYVIKSFWCAKSKTSHPLSSEGCSFCKNGFAKWKGNALLVEKTEELNKSIDILRGEINALNEELNAPKVEERAAKAK